MIESLICLIMWLVICASLLNSCYTGEGGGNRVMLRHSSRITRFGLHVVVYRCDCDIIWTPILFDTLDTLILHFTSSGLALATGH